MILKRFFHSLVLSVLVVWLCFGSVTAQPAGYYNGTEGLTGVALRSALHNIIKDHQALSYSALWSAFEDTDKKSNGKVWDMYSDIPAGTPPYQYTFITDQCGNYSGEGDCYNREHSWPKSWFNDGTPMITDLFHIYPTDGYVNGKRSNYPFGEVGSASWTSLNGSRLGNNSYPGNSEVVFEPIDAYKGDFARTYFYMSTRYYTEDAGWESNGMVSGANLNTWARNMLLEWHHSDPVSQKEIDRNNAVYSYQSNRNPFIDHPEFADKIWGDPSTAAVTVARLRVEVYPNPCTDELRISVPGNQDNFEVTLYSADGRVALSRSGSLTNEMVLNVAALYPGLYLLEVTGDSGVFRGKIVKNL